MDSLCWYCGAKAILHSKEHPEEARCEPCMREDQARHAARCPQCKHFDQKRYEEEKARYAK